MKFLRNILIIVVPFYYIIVWLRNGLYDLGIMSSKSYDFPIICVGNLSVGGTGKTPMIEYLIRLIQNDYRVATLSRGYKRQTSGFLLADQSATADTIGDEPFQFFSKFNNILVSVDTNRQRGISKLMSLTDSPEVILLDDAYQHRPVKAGLNILLTTFDQLYVDDILLPTGNLREPISGAKRADLIVVTKCHEHLQEQEKDRIRSKLNFRSNQKLFFSNIVYADHIYSLDNNKPIDYLKDRDFTLVTGIADSTPLVNYLSTIGLKFDHLNFKDHHRYTETELKSIKNLSCVLTTEKDFMRLKSENLLDNLFYLPIETKIQESAEFESRIRNFLRS